MGTAYSTILADLRTEIGEDTAIEWTDAQLYRYVSRAEQWLSRFLAELPGSGRFRYQESLTLTGASSTIAFSALAKTLAKVYYIDMLSTAGTYAPLREIPESHEAMWEEATNVGPSVTPGYILRNDTFVFKPVSSSDRTMRFTYSWTPAAKSSGGSTLETPAEYDDIVVARARYDALAAEGESDDAFDAKYANRLGEIESWEVARGTRGHVETVRRTRSRRR